MADAKAIEQLAAWVRSSLQFIRDNFQAEPDTWQLKVLVAWDRGDQRIAMKACKGPGKTAVLAWLIWHFLVCNEHPKIAATSITLENLGDNLWTELAKWRNKSPFIQKAFKWQKTRIYANDHEETWWASARGWSKTADAQAQADTLAGLHADNILFVLDECGAIPDAVMASAEAALATDVSVDDRSKEKTTNARILMAGNPIQRSGPLYRACTKDRHLWTVVTITGDPDNPERSPRISIKWAKDQIEQYGKDNPWVLANVFGEFPGAAPIQFIDADLVEAASQREAVATIYDPFIFGVDVARFGDDRSVIYFRKGPDGRTHPPQIYRALDTMQLAAKVAFWYEVYHPDAVFVDAGAMGAGVIDRLRMLKIPCIEVHFGGKPDGAQKEKDSIRYANKRAEMAGLLREWLKHGAIPDDEDVKKELPAVQYAIVVKDGKDTIILEPKEVFKDREGYSPDIMDALMCTFAFPVQKAVDSGRAAYAKTMGERVQTEYDPLQNAHDEYERALDERARRVRTEYDPLMER